jgi:hypothetical protein
MKPKLTLEQLTGVLLDKVVIDSFEGSIYQAAIVAVDQSEQPLWLTEQQRLRCRNLTEIRELLAPLTIDHLYLRQNSPYDEMIGQPTRSEPNTLLLELTQ